MFAACLCCMFVLSKGYAEKFNLHVRNCKGGEGGGFVDDANGALSRKVL